MFARIPTGLPTSDNGHQKCAVYAGMQADSKDCAVEYPFICIETTRVATPYQYMYIINGFSHKFIAANFFSSFLRGFNLVETTNKIGNKAPKTCKTSYFCVRVNVEYHRDDNQHATTATTQRNYNIYSKLKCIYN